MFVQFLFVGQGNTPGSAPSFPRASIRHPFGGRKVNIKVIGEVYTMSANFSIPVAYYITKGISSSLSSKAQVPRQAPRRYVNDSQFVPDTYFTSIGNDFMGGEPLWFSDVDGNRSRAIQNFADDDAFIHKNVMLIGDELEIFMTTLFTVGGDRLNDVYQRVLYLDITPV